MKKLLSTLLYVGIIVVTVGVGKVALSAEVQQPKGPEVFLLNDGTRCVVWNNQLECDFEHRSLVRDIAAYRGALGSCQAELVRRKWYES